MRKRSRQIGALLLASALVFTAASLPESRAANAVEIGQSCSVNFNISGDWQELRSVTIPVRLYKVADISASGRYTALEAYKGVDFGAVENSGSASVWMERAAEASKIASSGTPDETGSITNGGLTIDDLSTGLYLVEAEEVESEYYEYSFTPYLLSLPDNRYYDTQNDAWQYDVDVTLKPERKERFGSLVIEKNLVSHNGSMGDAATFVFRIDIETLKGERTSKNVALKFEGTGNDTATIKDIPAGSKVTVEEVYEGAGYRLTSDTPKVQTVENIPADGSEKVTFKNESDGTITGGYGVINHYSVDENGQYVHEQLESSSDSPS